MFGSAVCVDVMVLASAQMMVIGDSHGCLLITSALTVKKWLDAAESRAVGGPVEGVLAVESRAW
jgi:hypothetical protein